MFERFTERARRTIFAAKYIAGQTGGPEIETEHLLLGLLKEDQSLARRFLGSPWALDQVWRQVSQRQSVREKPLTVADHKLRSTSKCVLTFAAAEAETLSSRHIGTGHLLLGLLRDAKCFAAEILHQQGVHLVATREEMLRMRHDDSVDEQFLREGSSLPEVVELRTQLKSTMERMKDAIAHHNFAKARSYSDEERPAREKLYQLCQQHGLSDWLYD